MPPLRAFGSGKTKWNSFPLWAQTLVRGDVHQKRLFCLEKRNFFCINYQQLLIFREATMRRKSFAVSNWTLPPKKRTLIAVGKSAFRFNNYSSPFLSRGSDNVNELNIGHDIGKIATTTTRILSDSKCESLNTFYSAFSPCSYWSSILQQFCCSPVHQHGSRTYRFHLT